jgi:hypothetical protein
MRIARIEMDMLRVGVAEFRETNLAIELGGRVDGRLLEQLFEEVALISRQERLFRHDPRIIAPRGTIALRIERGLDQPVRVVVKIIYDEISVYHLYTSQLIDELHQSS